MTFPKKIHLVFFPFKSKKSKTIPKDWDNNYRKWIKLHPDFDVKLWNLEECRELIKNSVFPEFLDIFDNYKYDIQRVDSIRPFILYEKGGIYSDLDIIPKRNFSKLYNFYDVEQVEVLLAISSTITIPSNHIMISKRLSKFWLEIIKEMIKRSDNNYISKHRYVFYTTGPSLLNDIYIKYKKKCNNCIHLIGLDVLDPHDTCDKNPKRSSFEFIENKSSKSWASYDTILLNKIYCSLRGFKKVSIIYQIMIYLLLIIIIIVIIIYNILR